jgi:hypothetical protein
MYLRLLRYPDLTNTINRKHGSNVNSGFATHATLENLEYALWSSNLPHKLQLARTHHLLSHKASLISPEMNDSSAVRTPTVSANFRALHPKVLRHPQCLFRCLHFLLTLLELFLGLVEFLLRFLTLGLCAGVRSCRLLDGVGHLRITVSGEAVAIAVKR